MKIMDSFAINVITRTKNETSLMFNVHRLVHEPHRECILHELRNLRFFICWSRTTEFSLNLFSKFAESSNKFFVKS